MRRPLLALALVLVAALAAAAPVGWQAGQVAVYPATAPSWYLSTLARGERRVRVVPSQGASALMSWGLENSYGPFALSNSSAIGGPNGLLGETGYSTGTRTTRVQFSSAEKYEGSYSLNLYAYSNGGYALTNITLSATLLEQGSLHLYVRAVASYDSATSPHSVWVRVRVNGQTVLEWRYVQQGSWTGASWTRTTTVSLPAGTVRIELLAYAWAYSTSYTTTLNAYFDLINCTAPITSGWTAAGSQVLYSQVSAASWAQLGAASHGYASLQPRSSSDTSSIVAVSGPGFRFFASRRSSDNALLFGRHPLTLAPPSGGGSSTHAPCIATDGSYVYVVVKSGSNQDVWFNRYSISSGAWSTWTKLQGLSTAGAPACVVYWDDAVKPVLRLWLPQSDGNVAAYDVDPSTLTWKSVSAASAPYGQIVLSAATWKEPVNAQLSVPSGASLVDAVYRYEKPIVHASVGDWWMDEVRVTTAATPAVALAVSHVSWSVPASTVTFYDAAMNALGSFSLSAGSYYFAFAQAPAFAKLNSTLHYAAACGNGTSFVSLTAVERVAFKVEDFGQGFAALKAYTLDGRLVHAVRLDALGQAVLNLTLYAPFSLSLWKPGEERAFGIVTVSQLNYHIHVVPAAVELKEAGWARAYYNRSANAFVVEADCVAPPCAVKLYKIAGSLQNRTLLAAWTCSARYCRYTLLAADPLVQAEVSDSEGRVAVGFAGLSLPFNPWLAPIATWFAERAFGLQHLFGSASAAARFIVFLVALAVFWSMSTVGQWEVGLLAACAVLLVSQLWTGFDFLSSAVGLATFIAAFSLVIKKVREV